MILSWENTKVNGSLMKLYLGFPDGQGPFPALVVIQHQGGVDEFVQEMVLVHREKRVHLRGICEAFIIPRCCS